MDFFQVINKRKAIRKFIPNKRVSSRNVKKILETVNLAPSAGNLQSYKVFVIKNNLIKKKIYHACYSQRSGFLENASLILIFSTDPAQLKDKYGQRGERLYTLQDATIAATFAMLAATALGYASCWVGSFDDRKIQKTLMTPLMPVAAIIIGYPAETPSRPKRKPLPSLVKYLD
jgi:nitroreductase